MWTQYPGVRWVGNDIKIQIMLYLSIAKQKDSSVSLSKQNNIYKTH